MRSQRKHLGTNISLKTRDREGWELVWRLLVSWSPGMRSPGLWSLVSWSEVTGLLVSWSEVSWSPVSWSEVSGIWSHGLRSGVSWISSKTSEAEDDGQDSLALILLNSNMLKTYSLNSDMVNSTMLNSDMFNSTMFNSDRLKTSTFNPNMLKTWVLASRAL